MLLDADAGGSERGDEVRVHRAGRGAGDRQVRAAGGLAAGDRAPDIDRLTVGGEATGVEAESARGRRRRWRPETRGRGRRGGRRGRAGALRRPGLAIVAKQVSEPKTGTGAECERERGASVRHVILRPVMGEVATTVAAKPRSRARRGRARRRSWTSRACRGAGDDGSRPRRRRRARRCRGEPGGRAS